MGKLKFGIFSFCLLTIFLFPILPQYIYIIGGINVVNMLIAIFVIIYVLLYGKVIKPQLKNDIIFYWLFMIMVAIRYLIDSEPLKAITYMLAFVLLQWFFISIIDSESRFSKAVDTLIAAGCFLGVLGIIEAIFKTNFIQLFASSNIEFFYDVRYGLLRIMTTFGQPITYGLYQVFVIVLINYRMGVVGKNKQLKLCYFISVLNIFLSVSRIPILAYILVQIVLIYHKSQKKFLNYLIIGCVVILICIILGTAFGLKIPFVDDLVQTISQIFSGNTESTSKTIGVGNRFDLWSWVYLSMGNHWIWGNGMTAKFAYEVYTWQTKTSIENQYLFVLWHNGIVGLVMLILSYISTLIFTWKRRKQYINQGNEKISFNVVMFVIMIVYYIAELGVQETDMTRMYSVFIALIIAYNRIANKTIEKKNIEMNIKI